MFSMFSRFLKKKTQENFIFSDFYNTKKGIPLPTILDSWYEKTKRLPTKEEMQELSLSEEDFLTVSEKKILKLISKVPLTQWRKEVINSEKSHTLWKSNAIFSLPLSENARVVIEFLCQDAFCEDLNAITLFACVKDEHLSYERHMSISNSDYGTGKIMYSILVKIYNTYNETFKSVLLDKNRKTFICDLDNYLKKWKS